jgi:hypothetical protein
MLAKVDVLIVSRALELALFMDAKLDVSKGALWTKTTCSSAGLGFSPFRAV